MGAGAGKSTPPSAKTVDSTLTSASATVHADTDSGAAHANAETSQKDAAAEPTSSGEGTIRMARYAYAPRESDQAQISLIANDLVRVFEVTEWGWAAGVKLCKDTMHEIGDAGWFPAGYLYPPDHPITK